MIWRKIKIKLKESNRAKKIFWATMFISYFGALIIGVACALLSPNVDINQEFFTFGPNELKTGLSLYLLFSVSEVLAPTTITFSGTVLLLQSKKESVIRTTLLWVIIIALVVLSVCMKCFNNLIGIKVVATIIVLISILAIALSASISNIELNIELKQRFHKQEISDGKLSF